MEQRTIIESMQLSTTTPTIKQATYKRGSRRMIVRHGRWMRMRLRPSSRPSVHRAHLDPSQLTHNPSQPTDQKNTPTRVEFVCLSAISIYSTCFVLRYPCGPVTSGDCRRMMDRLLVQSLARSSTDKQLGEITSTLVDGQTIR